MTKFTNNYNLEERTAKFGELTIELCKQLKQDNISAPIINQFIRSSTNTGAYFNISKNRFIIEK